MMDRQAALQEKNKHNRTVSTRSIGECTFVPKITQKVPDFATLHEHLQFDLNNAKEVK